MKKPTFSTLLCWLLSIVKNIFSTDLINYLFVAKSEKIQRFTFQKNSSRASKGLIIGFLIFLFSINGTLAQVGTKFSPRLDDGSGNKYLKVQGDVKVIGNTILTPKNKSLPFNDSGNNNDLDAVYLDIDGNSGIGNSTFSSSSADLAINNSCKKIVFAGLYWSAMYPNGSSTDGNCFNCGSTPQTDWNQVKLRLPGSSAYVDVIANKSDPKEVIFKGSNANDFNNSVYVCFKDITSLVAPLANADGTYTVANVRATTGIRRGGSAGGWTLVVIYESPTVSSKYISVFDGAQMTNVDSGPDQLLSVDIPISGFQTLPAPFPVNAKIGVAALDGDFSKLGDGLLFRNGLVPSTTPNSSFTTISNTLNPAPSEANSNFFNASITVENAQVTTRNPTSTNNLGFDIDYLTIPNPSNSVIPNGATQGTYRMFTNTTGGDGYAAFLTTFAVDIIEPKILLTKEVFDYTTSPPTNMGNKDVTLGQQLNYVIGFQNQGNDNARSFTITDVLPINTNFVYPTDIVSLPPSITVGGVTYNVTHTYNAATRTIVFTIPNQYVEEKDPRYEIRLRVNVVNSCNQLSDACSNIIQNIALSDYTGTYNQGRFGDQSLSSYTTCNVGIPQSTNFLVDVDDCAFTKNEVLCGNNVVISAANNYSSYKWSTSPFDNNGNTSGTIIGNSQTLTVTNPGTYYVYNTAVAPCLSITEAVTVSRFGGIATNPVIPFADRVVTCPNDGKSLPNIFLCGANATKVINTNISDGSTIVWEKLNEASCTAVTNTNCANESTSCTWTQVGTGASYTANTSGQFRLTLNYPGGCFNRFYFNVYQNLLNPTETHRDIICTTNGNITVGGVPTGYEYSLDGTTYQASNVFPITNPGIYTVYIRQIGVTTNPCIFTIPNIQIRRRNFTVSNTVTQPLCFGEKGSIKVAANDVEPQYSYSIYNGATLVNSVGPIADGDYTFSNLTPGITYQVRVTTQDGCSNDQWIYIQQPTSAVTATAAIVEPLTACSEGKIVISTQGGTAPYYYYINGSTTFQTSNEIAVTTPGVYSISIVDRNNCTGNATVTVPNNAKPTYNVTNTNNTCYGNGAEIRIDNVVANGYTMSYSIDNGATFGTNPVFSNLYPGTYNVVVKYSITYTSQWNGQQTKECQDPAVPVTITGPSSAVTASAGVGELAGCGPLQAGQPTGLLRITNVEGGTAPYQYSYDGGNTWENVSEKYVVSGTYSLAVRDALGCQFLIPYSVILDPKPADPIIDNNLNTIYNCDGSATATVIVNNPPTSGGTTYTYEYYMQLNGTGAFVPNSPITSNTFTNVPSGNHNVKVKYNINTVSSYSNLLREDFGRGGDTTSPGINSAYCWEKQDGNTLAYATCSLNDWHPWLMNDGDYVVTKALLPDHYNDFNWWLPKDHTAVLNSTPAITDGRFLAVNIGATIPIGAVLYSKPINDVLPNQEINVSLFMTNLLKTTNNLPSPQLRVQLVKNGTVIASQVVPNIPRDEQWHSSTSLFGSILKLNPGPNTSLDFQVISNSQVVSGNDLAIDDIHVYQIPKACGNEREFPVIIDGSQAFRASIPTFTNVTCSGGTNATISIAAENFGTAGYQYNVDGGTFQTTTVSPLVLSGFGVGTHTIIVRSDATGTCSYTLTQAITAPTAVTVTASVTTPPTCTTGATITAVGGGGTPAYQYELRQANGVTVVPGFSFSNNAQFTNVPTGNYTVFARDANSCVSAVGATVNVVAPTAVTASLAASSDLCYDTVNRATLVVTATGTGTLTYSLDGQAAQNDNTFTNVMPGTHTIVVTDSNNCTATISDIIIAPELKLTVSLIQDLTCLVNASIGNPVITGGNGTPYTYTVSRNGGTATTVTFPYTATQDGNYVFTVTDSKGCTATSNTVVVSPKTTPTLTFVKTDITCNNLNDGTITVTASNGFTSSYTYAIKLSTATTYTTQSTNQFTGLAAGTYNIKVIDSKGCESAVTNVTITNPSAVSGTISATDITCSTTGTVPAVVTVVGSGGSGSYQYSFNGTSNFTTTNTYPTSVATTVTAYIKDSNGCQFGPLSIPIAAVETIIGITVTDNGYDCSTTPAGGHVNIAAVKASGSGPVRFQIISGPAGYDSATNSDGEFKGLAPGDYVFQATDIKSGCSFTLPYTVKGTPDITAGGNVVTPIKCFGGTGTIQFTVSGVKDRGYDYVIRNAANAIVQSQNNVSETVTTITVATAQPAGVYTITVTDRKTRCTATYAVTLTQPSAALSFTAASTVVNCNNFIAQVTVTAADGTPNYSYAYAKQTDPAPAASAYGTNNVLSINTNNGNDLNWTIYVKDANDCSLTRNITISKDPLPTVTAVLSNQCTATSNSTFTITATGTGGVAPLSYSIDGVSFTNTTGIFTVSSRTAPYVVTVKDANGCTASASAVTVSPQLTMTAIPAVDITCTQNTTINLSANGGTGTYTYAVSFNGGSYTAASNPYVTAIAGTYTFRVTDSATPACQAFSTDIIVTAKTTVLTLNTSKVDVKCKGDLTGSITVTATSGKAPFEYSKDGGANYVNSNVFTNLAAGNYDIMIKDALGCTSASKSVTIDEPLIALTATANAPVTTTCSTSTTVTVTGHDGTAPYTYSFNGGAFTTTATYVVNDNGTSDQDVHYKVKDANGCITLDQFITVKKLNPPTITKIEHTDILCSPLSAQTSTVTLTAVNGTGTLTYEITAPLTGVPSNNTGVFNGLAGGVTYSFKVTDSNGCYATGSHTVPAVTPIDITGQKISNVLCNTGSTGIARYTVSGFSASGNYDITVTAVPSTLTYTQSVSGDVITLSNLAAGSYTVTVKDKTTQCSKSADVTFIDPSPLNLALVGKVNANCNVPTSKVTVSATGGTPGYTYAYKQDNVAPGATDYVSSNVANLNPSTNLNWDVWVKDANGCTAKLDVSVSKDVAPTVSATVNNQCLVSGSAFQIKAVGADGVAPYTYTISTGVAPSPADTFTVAPGTYTITVRDANGCTNTTPVTVNDVLVANAVMTKDLDCTSSPEAKITINVSGGKSGYTYRVSSDGGTTYTTTGLVGNVFTTATPGTFQFEVTDSNVPACVKITNSVTVNPIVYPVISSLAEAESIKCNGESTAAITITVDNSKGISPFVFKVTQYSDFARTFFVKDFGTQTSGLPAGYYVVTVTDAKGCTDSENIDIAEPTPILINAKADPITCGAGGISKGSVTISGVTGGKAPYDYYVTGKFYSNSALNQTGGTVVFNVVDPGLYHVIVKDANGCTAVVTPDLKVASDVKDLDITVTMPPANCTTGGSATVAVGAASANITGNGPFFFQIYTGQPQIYPAGTWLPESGLNSKQATFTDLTPGVSYTFVIYDTLTGCYFTSPASTSIPTNSALRSDISGSNNVACKGDTNGNVSFDVISTYGMVTPITYEIFDAITLTTTGITGNGTVPANSTLSFTDIGPLPVGTYYVLIKEEAGAANEGCSIATDNFSVAESLELLTVTASITKNVNCNADSGIISAIAHDGTAPYTYQYLLSSASAPTASTSGWTTNTTFATSTIGSYTVYAMDAYGCIQPATAVNLTKDTEPAIIIAAVDKCAEEGAFALDVTMPVPTGIGPYTIVVNGSAPQTVTFPYTISGLSSGLQTVIVTDANGCTDTETITLVKKLSVQAVPTKQIDCSTIPNGTITLNVADGLFTGTDNISDFSYEVNVNGGGYAFVGNFALDSRTVDYSVSAAGTYQFRITDLNGCSVESTVVTIDPKVDPTVSATSTKPSCPGVADGTITITATGGVAPYEYSIDNVNWQSSDTFEGLGAGTVNYWVRDTKLCPIPGSVPIVDPVLLDASATVTDFACSGGSVPNPAVVTVTVTAGTGTAPYTYSFEGSGYYEANTYPVTDLAGKTVNYSVKDFNGCIFNGTATVNPYQPLTDIAFDLTKAPTCPIPNAEVTLTVSGGYTPIAKYEIIAPIVFNNGNNSVFTNLAPNDYLFRVTDANGCSIERPFSVKPVVPIAIVGSLINDISCNSANGFNTNGSAKFTVTGFSSTGNYAVTVTSVPASLPFTQSAISPTDDFTLTGLIEGTYTVTVKDNTTGCEKSDSVTLTEPEAITFLTAATKVFCSQEISQITVSNVTGGTGVYTYAAVKAGVTPVPGDFTTSSVIYVDTNLNVADLSWDVYVKDANGCLSAKLTTSVVLDVAPTIVAPAQLCFVGSPLTVDLSPNTITTTYNGVKSYTVNGSPITGSNAIFNAPGTYKLGIKDDNGCEAFVNYIVNPQLLLDAQLIQDLTCTVDASVTLTATEGVSPYVTYEVDNGSGYVASANPFTTNVAGTYRFRVTDTQGCQAESQDVIVTPRTTPSATSTKTDVSCIGEDDGTITILPANGIAPYTFTLTGANNSGDTTGNYSGLLAGTYTYVVTDSKNCTYTDSVTINDKTQVTASHVVTPFGCNTANAPQDAVVTITAGEGTPGYTYSFDGGNTFQASASFAVNSAGTINYVVRDANGCNASGSAVVDPYTPPTDMDITASAIYCNTPGTVATVTINSVTGGVAPYTYEIISPVTIPSNGTNSFAGLAPNTYSVKVTDANGCSTTKAIEVKEANKISVTAQLVNDVFCNGGATGAVNFTVANYITAGSFTYNLSPAATIPPTVSGDVVSYTGLPAGSYTFTVTDGVSGCIATVANFTISEPAIALSSTSVATNINCNNDNATITVTAAGGTAPYQYAIARTGDPAPTTFGTSDQLVIDTNNGADMNWIVYVKDANGCTTTNPQVINVDTNPTIASAVATQCPSSTGTYDITVTASGFSTALQYSVDGVSFQTSNVITVTAPGTYNVTVKDANGCISAPTAVTILEPLTLNASITKVPTCNTADGEVTLTATGGTIPSTYEYSIDGTNYVSNNVFTGLAPNVTPYKFYVRDTGTGCVKVIDFKIDPATTVTGFALSKTPVTCNGGNDGTITATMAAPSAGINDNPVYMYSLNGGTPQASNLFTGLTAGTYTVDVISGRGCPATASITVDEPVVITVPAPVVVPFGCTSGTNTTNFATITVTGVTGGSGMYSIYEFVKNGTVVQRSNANVYTDSDLAGGSYVVNVFDNKGCTGSTVAPIIVNPFISLETINVVVNPAITCNNPESITVTVATTGGTPATLNYAVAGTAGNTYSQTNLTGVFTGLTVGNYIVTVTNPTTGCSLQKMHYVNNPNTFELKSVKTSDVICYGSATGAVELTLIDQIPTPTNEAGAFSYVVTGPTASTGSSTTAGPLSLTGLTAGSYTVTATLTNSPFCTVSTTFNIDQPIAALQIGETHTEITCISGNNDGTISASATGGWVGDYQYELVGPVNVAYSTQSNFINLIAGNYTVNVRDSKGCIASVNVTLVNPTPITVVATPSVSIEPCFGDKSASITASASGGQGSNYLYTLNYTSLSPVISSGPQPSPVFAGLGAGTYTITVTDGWNCAATSITVTIGEPTPVNAALVLATRQTCLTQSTLTLTASGGTAPYRYSNTENIATSTPMTGNSETISVPNGTFRYYVWDANGCASYVSNDVENAPLDPLTLELDIKNAVINCRGERSGDIVALAKGGLGNYVYTLVDGANNPVSGAVQLTPGNFTQLAAGTYRVNVTSGDCSVSSAVITITEPATAIAATPVVTNVTCNGNNDGMITVNATGGTGIIKYAIEPYLNQFFVSNVFKELKPGLYDVIAQDENGCFILMTDIEVTEPTPIGAAVVTSSVRQELCKGDLTGAFSITVTGGTAPYSTVLDDPKGTFVSGQVDFANLAGGDHTVYVKDAQGCTFELLVRLDASVTLDPVATIDYQCVNNGPANSVSVAIDPSNVASDVTYSLDSSGVTQGSNVFTNITPGNHFIMAEHKNGCVDATAPFTIDQVDPLTISLDLGGLNEIVVTVTGGSGVYQFSVNGESIGSNNKYIYFRSGDYTVTVTDSYGCSISATKYFEFIDIIIPPIFTPNGDGNNDSWKPSNTENYPDIKFVVYDRYGREVGKFGAGQSWDGKYNGTELPMGDYWYKLRLRHVQDDREFVGHFTLYR